MDGIAVITSNGNCMSSQSVTDIVPQKDVNIKVYKRRLWMLCLFSFLSMMSAMLFPQYVSMANMTMCFYDVSMEAVNWSGMIYMLVYAVFAFPISSVVNYLDLRWTVICTAFWNVLDVFGIKIKLVNGSLDYCCNGVFKKDKSMKDASQQGI
ncbi:putative MFS-type transporter C09D4.1 [Caerostris extrusa]|uniref:MFS-type transporter C09D4.1 n=1 Tax=Caerostris extrusa TaxID=172846 RepID=A0AAV4MJY0_CAEEX|nr:putative MFS-type transporter C09D4.1 [Caerostris extrusa]